MNDWEYDDRYDETVELEAFKESLIHQGLSNEEIADLVEGKSSSELWHIMKENKFEQGIRMLTDELT